VQHKDCIEPMKNCHYHI